MISHIQVLHQYLRCCYKRVLYLEAVSLLKQKLQSLCLLHRMQQLDAGFHRNEGLELCSIEY